jgi:uncharacterized membrane protein YfcA
MVNAIAGGGTLLTFPALIALGVSPLAANATSTVALLPGALSSMWGYRRELAGAQGWAIRFALPSLLGGLAGALLLLRTSDERFDQVVPFLVLGATLLFVAHGSITSAIARRRGPGTPVVVADPSLRPPPPRFLAAQFAVGIYGGYFGAGVGILMLGTLGLMGLTNIHRMNGLKNWGGFCMNLVAATVFAASGIVHWPIAATMAVGAVAGGYAGSRVAQRIGALWVRRAIVAIGFATTLWLLRR